MANIKQWLCGVALMDDGTQMTLWCVDPKQAIRMMAVGIEDVRDAIYEGKPQSKIVPVTGSISGLKNGA